MVSNSFPFLRYKKLDPRSVIIGFLVAVIGFMSLGATDSTFDKEGHYKTIKFVTVLKHFNTQSSREISFRAYKKEAHYLGLFANALDMVWTVMVFS